MFKTSYKIATVWGIPIRVHISLLILLTWIVLAQGTDYMSALFWFLFASLFFTSIALHELGHSFVAIRKHCRVHDITLMFMGGVAKMERIPSKPLDEFMMAIAGPLVSLGLGLLGITLGGRLTAASPGILRYLGTLLNNVGHANLVLACFNLLPAFPMDGGRVLRAALSRRLGRLKATYIAARIGKFVAIAFALVGLFGLPGVPAFGRNLILVMIGGFIYFAAGREYTMVRMQAAAREAGLVSWLDDADQVDDDNVVIISPPPYENGPESRSELQSGRGKRSLFGSWK